jgi:hypothetical protein
VTTNENTPGWVEPSLSPQERAQAVCDWLYNAEMLDNDAVGLARTYIVQAIGAAVADERARIAEVLFPSWAENERKFSTGRGARGKAVAGAIRVCLSQLEVAINQPEALLKAVTEAAHGK